jgi:hypothetical protein
MKGANMTARNSDDIPSYGTMPNGKPLPNDARDENEAIRDRTIASMERSIRTMLIAIGRDWERCGKAACARSRRCRGFVCEPEDDDET